MQKLTYQQEEKLEERNNERVAEFFEIDRLYDVVSTAGNFQCATYYAYIGMNMIFRLVDGRLIFLPFHAIVSIRPYEQVGN